MRGVDRATIASGVPQAQLLENAGRAVARCASRRFAPGPIAVLCGPGDNGGDGYVAARLLEAAGREITVFALGAPTSPASLTAMAHWRDRIAPLARFRPERFALVIDALFGGGLARALGGEAAAAVRALDQWAAAGGAALAVDVPSGVDGESGAVLGCAARARATVTFERPKPGHFLGRGARLRGDLIVAPIGLRAAALAAADTGFRVNGPSIWRAATPRLDPDAHKYRKGALLVWVGPALASGAARLTAAAALRWGLGAVVLAGERAALEEAAIAAPAASMTREASSLDAWRALIDDPKISAVAIGPGAGVGAATRARVEAALAAGKPVALDADALTSFENAPEALFAKIEGPVVLSPHEGEFRRLFGAIERAGLGDRRQRALAAAARAGAVVLAKGPDSVVAAPDGRAAVQSDAPSSLATAGSGDVLTGLIGASLALGYPAFEAANRSVYEHAARARRRAAPLIADDLVHPIDALRGDENAAFAR